jgi:hypothetical protein
MAGICWDTWTFFTNYHGGQFGPVVSFRVSDLLLFWIFRFIIAEALKTATRRGKIGTSTPVSDSALCAGASRAL